MFDEFEEGPERYENDLEDLMDREAFEDMCAERDEHNWDDRWETEPEDHYLDGSFEDRYYVETGEFEY